VSRPARVGIVGCGSISDHYAKNAAAFSAFDIVACADVRRASAEKLAADHDLACVSVDELIADPAIDIILNITPPAAHFEVTRQALAAGKHVYSEKPLALTIADARELVAEAERSGVRLGCAPDTFLSGAFQAARAAVDAGLIGEPLSASGAMFGGNQATWHPDPDIFYADGAGPLMDLGPYYLTAIAALLGPVKRVAGFASMRVVEREIAIGPRAGERFTATTPTHVAATLGLASGATACLVTSFEAPASPSGELSIHGSEAVLELPDPNTFGGPLRVRAGHTEWRDLPFVSRGGRDVRGLGLQDFVEAIAVDRPHRASAELACHVIDVARTILAAAEAGDALDVSTTMERPAYDESVA
jgi:predicted dehydrogenase